MLQFYSHRGLVDAVVIEGRRGDGRRGGVAASIGGEGGQLQVKNAGAGWRALREDAAASSSCPQSRPGAPPTPRHWHKRVTCAGCVCGWGWLFGTFGCEISKKLLGPTPGAG